MVTYFRTTIAPFDNIVTAAMMMSFTSVKQFGCRPSVRGLSTNCHTHLVSIYHCARFPWGALASGEGTGSARGPHPANGGPSCGRQAACRRGCLPSKPPGLSAAPRSPDTWGVDAGHRLALPHSGMSSAGPGRLPRPSRPAWDVCLRGTPVPASCANPVSLSAVPSSCLTSRKAPVSPTPLPRFFSVSLGLT